MFRGDEFIALVVTNPKTGLKKLVDVTEYLVEEFEKTTNTYYSVGFQVDFYRFVF